MGKRFVFNCVMCGDEIAGATAAEALEDARNTGWEEQMDGKLQCPQCIEEQEALF